MLLRSILDFIFPRFCPICGRRLTVDEEAICLHCNVFLPRTYHWKTPTANALMERVEGRAKIDQAVSYTYFIPKTSTASIVYDFKYHNNPLLARQIGEMMAKEIGNGFFSDIDGIIPVPIYSARRYKRGYNQSEEIAKGISNITRIPVFLNIIEKVQNTVSQTTLSRFERADNIAGVFRLRKDAHRFSGKHLLLIDDIITTGATTIGCCKELEQIPNIRISLLSFGCTKRN